MMRANYRTPKVDAEICRTCGQCKARKSCKLKAIVQFESNELPYIDREVCRGCGICLDECPFEAIKLE